MRARTSYQDRNSCNSRGIKRFYRLRFRRAAHQAAEQGAVVSRLSPILKIFAFLPPILLLVGTIGTVSCGKSFFPTVTATNTSSSSPTATATTGTFAFVTNFNDGKLSEFTRNTTTGKLTLVGTVAAGSKAGPQGLAATGNFLYAANSKDDTVLQYTIGSGAVLTPIGTGSVSDGAGTGPQQVVINPAGTFLWAANTSKGTISGWAITSGTGQLTSSGPLLQVGTAVPSLGTSNGNPGLMVIDSTGTYLYVDDLTNGVVSLFNISTGSPVFGAI